MTAAPLLRAVRGKKRQIGQDSVKSERVDKIIGLVALYLNVKLVIYFFFY